MKKQSIFILLSFILSACASSQGPAPIEYNTESSKKSSSTKTNATIIDEGEVISTGAFEVKQTEVISHDDNNISDEQYVLPAQSSKSKVIYHEVQVGETIEEIASKYGQKVTEIAALNDLAPPYYLDEFQILKIKQTPEKTLSQNNNPLPESAEPAEPLTQIEEAKFAKPDIEPELKEEKHEYIMPVKGKVITKFGDKTSFGTSKGISISAKPGTKVLSTAAGKVIYADYDATFGNLVIIKLDGKNIVTSYAHLQDIILTKGASIKQGDVVGYVGSTGKVTEPQLNFGIREGKIAKDPSKYVTY
jgi:murein DD-endopeptidase MepM/ murein hydrolase activator NlpD